MVEANIKPSSKIIVIGNGFDLSMGYKTSYSDFIKSKQFNLLLNSDNKLAIHLETIHGEMNWVDIEHELEKYAKNVRYPPDSHILKKEFTVLKTSLTDYLDKASERTIGFRFGIQKFINLNENEINGVYSLNFTTTASDICNKREKLYFVHGTTYHNNIVFGIADQKIPKEYNFLLKSDHHVYGQINLTKAILDANEVHFYGLSFGDTDNNHFEPAFSQCRDKKLVFYVHGLQGYEGVRNRLVNLTRNGLAGLKSNNEVIFFDTFNDRRTEITQEWLNVKYSQSY
jgi:Bacteriophage abortive infection AbiH